MSPWNVLWLDLMSAGLVGGAVSLAGRRWHQVFVASVCTLAAVACAEVIIVAAGHSPGALVPSALAVNGAFWVWMLAASRR